MKFNEKQTSKTINLAGGKAFKRKEKEELVFTCLTTFLENKFYESGGDRLDRIVELVSKCDDEFVAKLAVILRKEYHMRSVSHVLIGELAKRKGSLTREAILHMERPDDLMEIVAYAGITNQIKRGVRRKLFDFSPYQLAKYRGERRKVSLVDLFNLTHPNPKFASDKQKDAWSKLIKGELKSFDTWERKLSDGKDKEQTFKELIFEKRIGYMALLRNLRNIEESGNDQLINKAAQMIEDQENVKKSKQLPFRFYTAYQNVKNQTLINAIAQALEHSVSNIPDLGRNNLIAVDTSGSMTFGEESKTPINIAAIFAAALSKTGSEIILYDTSVRPLKYIKGTPVLAVANDIINNANGGGTETSLVFRYAQKKYDRIIIISDEESWLEGFCNNVQNHYLKYTRRFGETKVYAVDIQGYGTSDLKHKDVYHFTSWSEKIFDIMKGIDLVKYVEEYKI